MAGTDWILVGVSDSPGSRAALLYAAHAAARTECRLRIVHVTPSYASLMARQVERSQNGIPEAEILDRAMTEAGWYLPEDRIRGELVVGDRERVLPDLAGAASLVVLGHARSAPVGHRSSGALVALVAGRASVPVVAVPDGWAPSEPRGRVIVGLKRADRIPVALLQGSLRVAYGRHAEVELVHVRDRHGVPTVETDRSVEDVARDIERQIAHALGARLVRQVHAKILSGEPAVVLGQESEGADVLIIARRSAKTSIGCFGDTGRRLLSAARCPVMVLPVNEEPAERDSQPAATTARGRL